MTLHRLEDVANEQLDIEKVGICLALQGAILRALEGFDGNAVPDLGHAAEFRRQCGSILLQGAG